MKNLLDIEETPPALEQSFKAATKLKRQLSTDLEMQTVPLMGLSSLAKDIQVKSQEVSQNNDLGNMQGFLGINKALQFVQGELNDTSKLTEIDKRKKGTAKR